MGAQSPLVAAAEQEAELRALSRSDVRDRGGPGACFHFYELAEKPPNLNVRRYGGPLRFDAEAALPLPICGHAEVGDDGGAGSCGAGVPFRNGGFET